MGAKIKPVLRHGGRPSFDQGTAERSSGLRSVPEKPTLEMLAAGSSAGHVSVETAWTIWQAMLKTTP